MRVGVLTVSDTCSENQALDESGSVIRRFLEDQSEIKDVEIVAYLVVSDEKERIKKCLENWSNQEVDVIFTIGGTGCSSRDVTPEATKEMIEKELPGLSVAMLVNSLKSVPMAMLSRSVCGIRNKTLIINLPGSCSGALDCLKVVIQVLQHAVDLVQDKKDKIKEVHSKIKDEHARVHHCDEHQRHHLDSHYLHHYQYHQQHRLYHHLHHHHHPHQFHYHHHHNHRQSSHSSSESGQSVVNENMVALRPRESNYPILDVDEALNIVLQECLIGDSQPVPYDQCLHRVVASDVLADSCLPPFDASIKDGYAVIAADGAGVRKVLGGVIAGSVLQTSLGSGRCYRISTGAPLPPGADAVVQVEDTKLVSASEDGAEELEIEILMTPRPGQDIRPRGCDIGLKECILKLGTKIGPAEVGLLASAGNMSINCFKMPAVGVLSTGNELVEPESGATGGKIRDCNRMMLLNALKEHEFPATDLGISIDRAGTLLSCLKSAVDSVDVVISTGGVSMGEKDLVKQVLAQDLEATIHFGRIFMKPGKPTTFATFWYKGLKKYFFGLPGNPVSALVTFHLFVLPALRKLSGYPNPASVSIKARLSESMKLDGRPEYHRCVLDWSSSKDGLPVAKSTGNQLSSRLLSMQSANGLLKLPANKGPEGSSNMLEKDHVVDCILLKEI